MKPILLRAVGLSKAYGDFLALQDFSLDLLQGEVHVLFGENGAGKSTFISILAGVQKPSAGTIELDGQQLVFNSVAEARRHGISAVFQEFSLVPTLTVAQNLLLGDEPGKPGWVRKGDIRRRAEQLLESLSFDIDPALKVADLSRAQQQMVEIAKSFRSETKVLILDEPTASLTDKETERLFAIVESLKAKGVGVIYISHRMQEIHRIADRITVMRDGKKIQTFDKEDVDDDTLIELMAGRKITTLYPEIERHANPAPVAVLEGVSTAGGLRELSLTIRSGEVLGLAGLVGQGKSQVLRAIYGLDRVVGGRIRLDGTDISNISPGQALKRGVFYLPSDRKNEGLVLSFTSSENFLLGSFGRATRGRLGTRHKRRERELSSSVGTQVGVRPKDLSQQVARLSGGNQQKVLFGKGFNTNAKVYLFDEPTVGVDVQTRAGLYLLIKELVESGAAVVVASSDLPEVMNLAHRVCVVRGGRVVRELVGDQIRGEAVLASFFGEDNEVEQVQNARAA